MLLLALLAPVGPAPSLPQSPLPPEIEQRASVQRPVKAASAEVAPDLATCLADAAKEPLVAIENAQAWRDRAQGVGKVQASHCLGVGLSTLGRWQQALIAFTEARDAAPDGNHDYRARLGAMAGNAALAGGNADAALAALDTATKDAQGSSDASLIGDIALDRARALVALGRPEEAQGPLATAREALPGSAQAWLLSATLSRRLGKLVDAQKQIERADDLLPTSPDIGLEAGVIAVLLGHEDAARKSWQSVIDAAPNGKAADTARDYLAQLSAPKPVTGR